MDETDLPASARNVLAQFQGVEKRAERAVAAAEARLRQLSEDAARIRESVEEDRSALEDMIKGATSGSKLLADAWTDYEAAKSRAVSERLKTKSNPAPKASAAIKQQAAQLKQVRSKAKHFEWIVRTYEAHFPWLADLREQDDELSFLEEPRTRETPHDQDPARQWLSPSEWTELDSARKSQLALDRHMGSRKSNVELGRDYERYIGYLRERSGCSVSYQGIFEGLDDLGRDLICRMGNEVEVVQCKRWAKRKTIHEKHVFQLFGTMVLARLENRDSNVSGTFTTTTVLSERARAVAQHLQIRVEERVALEPYPLIKCNIGRDGARIYHLPFDQQYDRVRIEPSKGELWASTALEAEEAGFRRAKRWTGPES